MVDRERGHKPLNQVEIETMIARDVERLEIATYRYRELLGEEAKAKIKYKDSYNRAYLAKQAGTEKQKVASAELDCRDEYEEMELAAARAKAQREILGSIRSSLDAVRSLNANVRAQV